MASHASPASEAAWDGGSPSPSPGPGAPGAGTMRALASLPRQWAGRMLRTPGDPAVSEGTSRGVRPQGGCVCLRC